MARRQAEKRQMTREEIKSSAYKLIGEVGYDKATVDMITEEAGYSKGSFYLNWSNKEELLVEIFNDLIQEFDKLSSSNLRKAKNKEEFLNLIVQYHKKTVQDNAYVNIFVEIIHQAKSNDLFKEKILSSFVMFDKSIEDNISTITKRESEIKRGFLVMLIVLGSINLKCLGFDEFCEDVILKFYDIIMEK